MANKKKARSSRKPRTNLPPDTKRAIVSDYLAGAITLEDIERDYGVSKQTFYRWRSQYGGNASTPTPPSAAVGPDTTTGPVGSHGPDAVAMSRRIDELERELVEARKQRDAARTFAEMVLRERMSKEGR